ncbi:polymorphic toxin type 47 domain-containing protein [Pseudomonas tolaasii]|uniref:polymorphic toxin type 47 domain-containing protein n=1 Tax=Pseudomonas tolaasii TaxID=29442 RepID=UPI0018C881F9|nr:polymorphic toxin type 47 domain-containing protein [Pseudomonas tolaasii]MBY8943254.1 hypothetical protein [Pseudomonas tolaasii]
MNPSVEQAFPKTNSAYPNGIKIEMDRNEKSFPTEWRVQRGPNRGAEVNIDDPMLVPSKEGQKSPHIGYQTPGKRAGGGARRGHILLELVPVSRAKIGIP